MEPSKNACIKAHGRTSTAIVKKICHVSIHNQEFNMREDIISKIHTSFLQKIVEAVDKLDTFVNNKKLSDNQWCIGNNTKDLIQQIYPNIYNINDFVECDKNLMDIFKNVRTIKNNGKQSLYDEILKDSLNLITDEVDILLKKCQQIANATHIGTGSCVQSRELIIKIYTQYIDNLCIKLDTPLHNLFNNHISNEQSYYNDIVRKMLILLKNKYIKKKIDLTHITVQFSKLDEIYKRLLI